MAKTIEEIASDLQLSVTTVRLVLADKARQYRISVKTEERVRAYTEKHGYAINHTARSLKLQRTDTLALIVPRLSNPFFALLAEKLEIRCREAGLQLMVSCSYNDSDTQNRLVSNFQQRNIDGLFIVPTNRETLLQAADLFGNRMVLLDRDFGISEHPLVMTDNYSSSLALTGNILNRLNRPVSRIAFLVGDPTLPTISARLKGFDQALQQHQHTATARIFHAPHNRFDDGVRMMQQLLDSGQALPDAVITSSLPVFEGALHGLRERHGRIDPQWVLGTFDDHTMLDFLSNPVFSARQDSEQLVNAAFLAMEQLIAGRTEAFTHVATADIILRN